VRPTRSLLAGLLAFVPALALAAAPAATLPTKTAAPPTGGGMPQLNFHNPLTLDQVGWLIVIFAVLYVLLWLWALPLVAGVVEDRAASIKSDLEAAQQAKAEADAAVLDLTRATREAHAAAQARIAEAVGRAKAEAAEQARIANERLDAQLGEAEARIGQARQAAMGALRDVARETTEAIVTRLIGHPATADAVDAAVGGAMAGRTPGGRG
jgi:F-type H+-transporting ATPase subunit b